MERTLDYKGRWRNHTVAFRVSDEESKLLNDLVALSGLTKQDLSQGGCCAGMWWNRAIRECIRR